jgi:hypothetical protein
MLRGVFMPLWRLVPGMVMVAGLVARGVMVVRTAPIPRAVVVRVMTAFVAVGTRVVIMFDAALVVHMRVLRASPVGVMMVMVMVMVVVVLPRIRSVTAVVGGVRAGSGGRTGLRAGAGSRADDRAAPGGTAGRRRGRSATRVRRWSLGVAVAAG